MEFVLLLLTGGWNALLDYLSLHVLTCLVPAFFIAGALYALFPKEKILRYLGPNSPGYISYPMSVVAGLCLAVCSCTVLPLFSGIRRSGAGLGPAMVFLYTAPATNILAVIYTGRLIGVDFALARIILSISFAMIIGLSMSALFSEKSEKDGPSFEQALSSSESDIKTNWIWVFFGLLLVILLWGASSLITWEIKLIGLALLLVSLALLTRKILTRGQFVSWMKETWFFIRSIFPWLLIGVFAAGVLRVLIPEDFMTRYFGDSTLLSNLGAVLFGVVMYFPTLVEVPMARMFLDLGVGKGPLLAYLLADPVISLPSILVVRNIIGNKRLLWYVGIIIVCCTAAGMIYGAITN
ncbi:MAG: permease [Dehalococcoidia bacterium]|nr:permease [Dehalococcoidia bacterium]MDD5493972.1 permease [Dehalococcoidia bacterium]